MLPKSLLLFLAFGLCQLFTISNGFKPPTKFIDLTYAFDNNTVLWPGKHISFHTETMGLTPGGFWVASRSFCASEHSSTHIDAPYHFNEHGRKLHELPMEDLIEVPGVMIDIYDKVHKFKNGELMVIENYALTQKDVIEWEKKHGEIPQGSVVLVRTGWASRWGNRKLYRGEKDGGPTSAPESDQPSPLNVEMNFPSFDVTAARYLATERQVVGVGVDVLSIDTGNSKTFLAHRLFASRNIYMLENVANLHVLPPRGFHLWIVPFKIDFGTGAPTRVMARLDCKDVKEKIGSRDL